MVFVSLFCMFFFPILKPVSPSSPCKTVKNKNSDNELKTIQENPIDSIRKLKPSNPHKIMLGDLNDLNVNLLQNIFESIADVIQGTFDIFLLSETKFDRSFPDKQFCLNNFRIFRKDRNRYGGGIIFYVNENLPRKSLTAEIDDLIPSSQNEEFFISNVSKTIIVFW